MSLRTNKMSAAILTVGATSYKIAASEQNNRGYSVLSRNDSFGVRECAVLCCKDIQLL